MLTLESAWIYTAMEVNEEFWPQRCREGVSKNVITMKLVLLLTCPTLCCFFLFSVYFLLLLLLFKKKSSNSDNLTFLGF